MSDQSGDLNVNDLSQEEARMLIKLIEDVEREEAEEEERARNEREAA